MTQSAYFHFINCSLTIYIVNIMYILLLIYLAWKAVVITINCLFGTLYKSLWVLLAKAIHRNKLWNVGETGGQESHCPGHGTVTFVGIWSFLAWTSVVKRLFLLIKIIELCVSDQRIHKVCRFDHCQMFTSKLSYFEGFLYDDNPKAWQEIGQPVGWGALPLSIFMTCR